MAVSDIPAFLIVCEVSCGAKGYIMCILYDVFFSPAIQLTFGFVISVVRYSPFNWPL